MSNSRSIASPQNGPHERLEEIVRRHLNHPFQKPIQAHNREAFAQMQAAIQAHQPKQLILDSCCGTGYSTYLLAKHSPDALVIGIDQSATKNHVATAFAVDRHVGLCGASKGLQEARVAR